MNEELPEGWVETRFSELIIELRNGISTRPNLEPPGTPILRISATRPGAVALEERRYLPNGDGLLDSYGLREKDLLFTRYNGSIELLGVCGMVRGLNNAPLLYPDKLMRVRLREHVVPEFIEAFFQSRSVRQAIMALAKSSAGQQGISGSDLKDQNVRFAPLPEQHRIVEKVEALLEQVNRAKERLDRVPLILKRFRQAVLAAACSGELTREWRENHANLTVPVLAGCSDNEGPTRRGRLWGGGEVPSLTEDERTSVPTSWVWMKVGDLGANPEDAVQIGPMSMKSSEFIEHGVTVLNVGCVQPGRIDTAKCDFLSDARARAFARYRVMAKDVLFTRSGTVGRCAVAGPEHEGAVITFHLLRVRPDQKKCCSEYLWAAFQGAPSIRRQTGEGQIGSTRGGFNTRLLASLDVPIPPRPEQDQIVSAVRELFSVADTIERRVQAATARANKLPQAILSKAFTGELVPTEAELARLEGRTYETAEELLKKVSALGSEAPPTHGKGRGRRTRRAE